MYYRLVNVCDVIEKDGLIYFIDDDIYLVEFEQEIKLEYFEALKSGVSKEKLISMFNGNEEQCDYFLDELNRNNFLRKYESIQQYLSIQNMKNFNQKQFRYLEEKSERPIEAYSSLINSTVCIIGVGGVGSVLLESLVGAGILNYVLIDFDLVEESNFNRQYIFNKNDLGKSKVLCAKNYIQDRLIGSRVKCIDKKITDIDEFSRLLSDNSPISIVINAADYPANIENIVYDACAKENIACLGIGVGKDIGYWGPIKKGKTVKINFENALGFDVASFKPRSKPTDVSLGTINMLISTFASMDVILYLSGISKQNISSIDKRIYFDCIQKSIVAFKEC